jgi:hypothetical protein
MLMEIYDRYYVNIDSVYLIEYAVDECTGLSFNFKMQIHFGNGCKAFVTDDQFAIIKEYLESKMKGKDADK